MKKIQILGTGCPKCKKLAEVVEYAANEIAISYEMEKITDITNILQFGVMLTPALAVDGKVVSVGKIPSIEEIKKILSEN